MDTLVPKRRTKGTLFRSLFLFFVCIGSLPVVVTAVLLFIADSELSDATIVAFGLAALIFVTAASSLISRRLANSISRPMSQLAQGATEIARGNFSHLIKIDAKGEIGRVAKLFNYMSTELRRLNDMNLYKIIVEKTKTATIIKNIADGVIVTDPKNNILVLNSVAELWFGVKEETAINNSIDSFIKNKKLRGLIKNVAENGEKESPTVEIPIKLAGQWKESVLAAKAARVLHEDNTVLGIVTILRDITREKEIDRMKTELVSMVAHELRSPLTSVSGFSELLLDKDTTKDQAQEFASIILKESNRLSDLINKFLDISKIESGKSQAKKSPINLLDTVDSIKATQQHVAERKKISIEIAAPEELALIYADPAMMDQAFLNLISNAIKYSPENSKVTIRVQENADTIQIAVQDTGYGISKDSLPHIFEKFYRVTDHEKVREITGSGLGLPLVKQILEIHGGTISVKSTLGEGSTFTVTLPIIKNQVTHPIKQKEEETARAIQ